MACQRTFLGWDGPFLRRVVRWLWAHAPVVDGMVDLGDTLVVTPGQRASRRLAQLFAVYGSTQEGLAHRPPTFVTVGGLPEQLYRAPRPLADGLRQHLAWMATLRAAPQWLARLTPSAPGDGDLPGWGALVDAFARLHRQLAAAHIDPEALLPPHGTDVGAEDAPAGDEPVDAMSTADLRADAIGRLIRLYLLRIEQAGLADPQEARRRAVMQGACGFAGRIVLAGVADMPPLLAAMLEQVQVVEALVMAPEEEAGGFDELGRLREMYWTKRRLALADEAITVVDRPVDQADAVVGLIDRHIAADASLTPESIRIGLADETLGPVAAHRMSMAGFRVRRGAGRGLAESSPGRLLRAACDFLSHRRYEDLAALVRHPDVEAWLAGQVESPPAEEATEAEDQPPIGLTDWLSFVDKYRSDFLPGRIDGGYLGSAQRRARMKALHDAVWRLLLGAPEPSRDAMPEGDSEATNTAGGEAASAEADGAAEAIASRSGDAEIPGEVTGDAAANDPPRAETRRPISQWSERILELLAEVYGPALGGEEDASADDVQARSAHDGDEPSDESPSAERKAEGDAADWASIDRRQTANAILRFAGLLREQTRLAPDEPLSMEVTLAEAMQWTLLQAGGVTAADPVRQGAVELVGWLELAFDDAPLVIVTSFHEGALPGSQPRDAFLPVTKRQALGLPGDMQRYARDLYLLAALTASRPNVHLIAGRRDVEDQPVRPSRLMLACDDDTLVRRLSRFVGKAAASDNANAAPQPTILTPASRTRFGIPLPVPPATPMSRLRVTAFRDYLACPYRFYLRHVLGLDGLSDDAVELDGGSFGTLLHEVLERFARGPAAHSDDFEAVRDDVLSRAAGAFSRRYGDAPPASVIIQRELAMERLEAFARWQAAQVRAGWSIDRELVEVQWQAPLDVDGEPFIVRGRIDRIDRHHDGRMRLIDYKSGDSAKAPKQTHRKGEAWIDLQLPLYAVMVDHHKLLPGYERTEVGYMLLPRRRADVTFAAADWDASQFHDAELTAHEVVRRIRAGVFWPPGEPLSPSLVQRFDDPLAGVCMDRVLGRQRYIEEAGR